MSVVYWPFWDVPWLFRRKRQWSPRWKWQRPPSVSWKRVARAWPKWPVLLPTVCLHPAHKSPLRWFAASETTDPHNEKPPWADGHTQFITYAGVATPETPKYKTLRRSLTKLHTPSARWLHKPTGIAGRQFHFNRVSLVPAIPQGY